MSLAGSIANAETRLTWRMLGIAGLVLAVMRLLRNPEDVERRIRRKVNTGSGEVERRIR